MCVPRQHPTPLGDLPDTMPAVSRRRRMIRRLCLVLAVGALGACAPAPAAPPVPAKQDTAADEAKMRSDLNAWFDAYNAGNADAVAAQYAEDGILMPPAAPAATGRAAIREFIAKDSAITRAAGLALKNGSVTGIGF